jgi:hypothetical protein
MNTFTCNNIITSNLKSYRENEKQSPQGVSR